MEVVKECLEGERIRYFLNYENSQIGTKVFYKRDCVNKKSSKTLYFRKVSFSWHYKVITWGSSSNNMPSYVYPMFLGNGLSLISCPHGNAHLVHHWRFLNSQGTGINANGEL